MLFIIKSPPKHWFRLMGLNITLVHTVAHSYIHTHGKIKDGHRWTRLKKTKLPQALPGNSADCFWCWNNSSLFFYTSKTGLIITVLRDCSVLLRWLDNLYLPNKQCSGKMFQVFKNKMGSETHPTCLNFEELVELSSPPLIFYWPFESEISESVYAHTPINKQTTLHILH